MRWRDIIIQFMPPTTATAPLATNGTYSTVTLTAPSSAKAGSKVSVVIHIKNRHTATMHFAAIGMVNNTERFIDWVKAWIGAGQTQSFFGSFTMPDKAVTVNAYSRYEDQYSRWVEDASTSKKVMVEAVGVVLLDKATKYVDVTLEPPPPPAEVVLLARYSAEIDILQQLYLLDSKQVTVTPTAPATVVLMDKRDVQVIAGDITGVVLLDTYEVETYPGVDAGVFLLDSKEVVVLLPGGTPEPPPEEGINWWLWGGLAAVAVVVVIMIARRKG